MLSISAMTPITFGRVAMRRAVAPKVSSRTALRQHTAPIANPSVVLIASRPFSAFLHDHSNKHEPELCMPVTKFTEDEEMVRDATRMWANQELKPLVRKMDEECKTRPEVIQGLFDHGFMGMVSCFR